MKRFWICLVKVSQGFEYASSSKCQSSEYGKVSNMWGLHRVLNMREYAWIYLNKQSSEYAKILNVSDTVHGIRSLYKLLNSYRDRGMFRYCQIFQMERFTKRIMPKCRHSTRNFWGWERIRRTRALR